MAVGRYKVGPSVRGDGAIITRVVDQCQSRMSRMTERAWEQGAICQLWIGGGERGEGEKPETRRLKNKIKETLDKKK